MTDGSAKAPGMISAGELAAFVTRVFASRGIQEAHAAQVADVLTWADLRGIDSHGVERVPSYLNLIANGSINPHAAPRLDDAAPALFRIDADRAAGPVPMMMALEEATRRARLYGVATGLVCRCAHTGAVGYYVQQAARQGFVAMVMGSGPPLMAYHGASLPSLSTSPLAIGVPGGPDGALMLDMASAVASNGKLKQAQREGKPIPEGWALDAEGRVTTDAAKAAVALPIGGPKGAGLGLLFECVTSVLAGAPLLANMLGPGRKSFHMQSEMLIIIDASKIRPLVDFDADVRTLADVIRDLPKAEGFDAIRLPGERSEAEARRREAAGVPISARLRAQLQDVAVSCGVAGPLFIAG